MAYDVIIIGGGQAGLALEFSLKQKNIPFVILDENEQTGMSWRKRYDSLRLFTPRSYSQLHGFYLKGDPKGFPDNNEIADYLAAFKIQNELPVHREKVIKLTQNERKQFLVTTPNKMYTAKQVVIATGAFHNPFVPNVQEGTAGFEIHASKYQNPSQIPNGNVLIVGAGNTGVQIAAELSKTHQVTLSQSNPMKHVPQNIAGRSLFWLLETFLIGRAKADSFIGKMLREREPLIGNDYKTVQNNVEIGDRLKEIKDDNAYFNNGISKQVQNVIWTTGYRNDYSWIQIDGILNGHGELLHHFGVTNVAGLYFIGLSWQSRRSSALIYGVSDDANYIAKKIQ
ncbi:flavin-containing monooxygenase [Oceanobacillus sojae]|uniref:flavin-containing monooxygenase n=1 Tax=Oceanobacillus sojae TaxID=582851 RepID=UPI0009884585|nr:NAD(P)/FAD-dependent oxidoreductase [Oceanobacillus sojae]